MAKEEPLEAAESLVPAAGQSNRVYAAMLTSVDESVGRILKRIDELKLVNDTIVIFTSDNGGAVHFGKPPATSNTPLRMGKGYAYEGGLRIPLLIRVPGMTKPGSVCDVPVISHDWFPALIELVGGDKSLAATAVDGLSFVPLLRGASRLPERTLFWHYPHYWNQQKVSPYSVVRAGDWKLIRFYETDREELYNLRQDPGERMDLTSREPERRRALALRLDAWLKEVGAQMPMPRVGSGGI